MGQDMEAYLRPGVFVNSDHPDVVAFAHSIVRGDTKKSQAMSAFVGVRDHFRYDPYDVSLVPQTFYASTIITRDRQFCQTKAIILAAVLRVFKIPSRLGFADIRNHLSSGRLSDLMGTDIFCWHGFTEAYLSGRWIKVTPTFNATMCEKFGLLPLDFDGENDCMLHPFDRSGHKHMEYVGDRGHFVDFPFEEIRADLPRLYPKMYGELGSVSGDFSAEVDADLAAGNYLS